MALKKSTHAKKAPEAALPAEVSSRQFTLRLPKISRLPMPTSWTPVLMVLLLIATFLIGMLYTKVQYLEGGATAPAAGTTAGSQQQAAVTPGAKVDMSMGNLPVLGNANAKVQVVEFADFQCPFCEQWFQTVWPQLKKDYVDTGKIAFAWRDYPFLGQESTDAANAARCANDQGKFWDYHDYLYTHQGQENSGAFSKANLEGFAATMGLDTTKFNNCMDSNQFAKDAATDLSDGQKAGVNGTPTVFINGVPVVGAQPYSAFQTAIDQALAGK
ncbi:MAG TPA: DsbA family protein [Candidatus Saccharimonadales bacterium]|nr:DsbA family protein [Candidatus Saccharimonadales bacterium]